MLDMMRDFKFFTQQKVIAIAHDGGYIYAGEYFYVMYKEDLISLTTTDISPKYTISRRIYDSTYQPNYDVFWYFQSRHNAEYLRNIWMRQDEETVTGYANLYRERFLNRR